MRKFLLVMFVAGLVGTMVPAGMAGSSSRRVKIGYAMSSGTVTAGDSVDWTLGTEPHALRVRQGETSVRFKIADASGNPVLTQVYYIDGHNYKHLAEFCSARSKAIDVTGGEKIAVRLMTGTCSNGATSVVTRGTITATFSK